jgi:hypothetical protein
VMTVRAAAAGPAGQPESSGIHKEAELKATVGPIWPALNSTSVSTSTLKLNTIFQIDYDLRNPGRNYDSLIPAIKALGSWAHALKSTWLVESNSNAYQLAVYLRQHMDANDGLLVTRLQGDASWAGLPIAVVAWIQARLRRAA